MAVPSESKRLPDGTNEVHRVGTIKDILARIPACWQCGLSTLVSVSLAALVGVQATERWHYGLAGGLAFVTACESVIILTMLTLDWMEGRDWDGKKPSP